MLRLTLLLTVLATGALAQPVTIGQSTALCNASAAPAAKHFDEGLTKSVGSPDPLYVWKIVSVVTESEDGTTAVCSGTLVKDLPALCPKLSLLARLVSRTIMAYRMFLNYCLDTEEAARYLKSGQIPSSYPSVDETPSQLRWMIQISEDKNKIMLSMWNPGFRQWDHWFDLSF